MKITKIRIENYRSCIATEFSPNEDLSALIGPNGSGKTTVLTAIRLLRSLLLVRNRRYQTLENPATPASEIKVWYDFDGKQVIHTAILNLVTDEKNEDEIISSKEYWYMHSITGSKRRINIPAGLFIDISREPDGQIFGKFTEKNFYEVHLRRMGVNKEVYRAIHSIVNFITRFNYYSASQFTNPSTCPISFEVESDLGARRGISISGHKKFLYDMYQAYRTQSDSFAEFMDVIGKSGIGLVDDITFNEIKTSSSNYTVMTGGKVRKIEKNNLLVVPSFLISGNSLSPSQLSEGSFKTIALVYYLVNDKSSLLMIEEPELCIHHGLLASIVELICVYSKEKQIIVSTHSDSVLDSIEVESVFSVKRHLDEGTIVSSIAKRMKKKELSTLKNYLKNEGNLGEYWKHGDLEND
jgi:AAA15 family ATPase/GTPase